MGLKETSVGSNTDPRGPIGLKVRLGSGKTQTRMAQASKTEAWVGLCWVQVWLWFRLCYLFEIDLVERLITKIIRGSTFSDGAHGPTLCSASCTTVQLGYLTYLYTFAWIFCSSGLIACSCLRGSFHADD